MRRQFHSALIANSHSPIPMVSRRRKSDGTQSQNQLGCSKDSQSVINAFTLVALLVVIAIIGILAALLFPAISAAKAHAKSTACKNHLRQMNQALQMYVHDHDNKYVYHVNPYDPSLN